MSPDGEVTTPAPGPGTGTGGTAATATATATAMRRAPAPAGTGTGHGTADPAGPATDGGGAVATDGVAAAGGHRRRPRSLRLLVVFAVLAAALVYLLVEGLGSSLDYFDTVHQALAQRATLGTSTFRLEGTVVPGSIERTATGTDFTVSGSGETVAVENQGSPPQLFAPTIPVVVVGHFASSTSAVFVSDQIMVKHSASYIASHPGRVRAKNGSVR